jgi:hypothetical protein
VQNFRVRLPPEHVLQRLGQAHLLERHSYRRGLSGCNSSSGQHDEGETSEVGGPVLWLDASSGFMRGGQKPLLMEPVSPLWLRPGYLRHYETPCHAWHRFCAEKRSSPVGDRLRLTRLPCDRRSLASKPGARRVTAAT